MRTHNTHHAEESDTRSTRRRALHAIGGILLGTTAIGTAEAHSHVTEITGPTIIDEPGEYVLAENISSVEGRRNPIIQIEADRVTLDGNGYTISHRWEGYAIKVNSVVNVTLSNIIIRHMTNSHSLWVNNGRNCTIEQSSMPGIRVHGSNNTVRRNDLRGESGIRIDDSDRNRVQNNVIHAPYAMEIYEAHNNIVENNEILYGLARFRNSNSNRFVDNVCEEILLGGDHNTVTGNHLTDVSEGYISVNGDHNTVTQNYAPGGISDNGENNRIHANTTD